MKKTKASLSVKNNYYYAIVRYNDNGERKKKWISMNLKTSTPLKDVMDRLEQIREEYENKYCATGEMLFTNYLEDWVKRRKGLVANSTWEGINVYAQKHIIPYFEPMDVKLKDLAPSHIQDYYNYKYNSGRCDKKEGGLSIESIIKHKSVFMTALDDAVVEGLISRNPAKYVKLPAKRTSKRKENFLTLEQAKRMLKLFEETPFFALIYTSLFYGLRKSEALGLKWNSVDFVNNTITIENVIVKNYTIEEKKQLKTASSYHTFPLINDVRCVLLRQRSIQAQNKIMYGGDYYESEYVFTWDNGKPFRPDSILKSFQRVLKRNHFSPIIRFHDLRHSIASILYEKGWDLKEIQMWLRHADIKVTGNVYTHIKQNSSNSIPECLQNVFNPTPVKKGMIVDFWPNN